jgi:hypothetical protein
LDTVLWAFTLFLDIFESKGSKIGVSVLSSIFQGPLGKVLWAITHLRYLLEPARYKKSINEKSMTPLREIG